MAAKGKGMAQGMAQGLPQTTKELEATLALSKYKPFKRMKYEELTPELLEGVKRQDGVVTFGEKAITLFDDLCKEFNRLPTQKEYIARGVLVYEKYWSENKHTHKKIKGYPFNKGVRLGVMDRLARTYTSKIVEMHLEMLLKELGFTVKTHKLIDSIMGVDMIVEDSYKRYYIHVTTSRKGIAGAEKSVRRKEKRSKFITDTGVWVNFGRDFTGDCTLCYESVTPLGDDSTKFVNGNPLFRKEFIKEYFYLKKISKAGEYMSKKHSKVKKFIKWAKNTLKVDIEL